MGLIKDIVLEGNRKSLEAINSAKLMTDYVNKNGVDNVRVYII